MSSIVKKYLTILQKVFIIDYIKNRKKLLKKLKKFNKNLVLKALNWNLIN
jgi:hypothetical protein